MRRFILWSLATFIFGGLALSPAVLIYLYNEPPPVVYTQRKVITPIVPPGGELKIQISADMNKHCSARVHRSIIDATGLAFTFPSEPRPDKTDYMIEMTVPLGAAPGHAYYSARLEWVCNFVQRWWPQEVIQRNIDFQIAPAEGQLAVPEQQGIYQAPYDKSEYARLPQ